MHLKHIMFIAALAAAVGPPALSQGRMPKRRYFDPHTVSSPVRQIVFAVGTRVQRPGKERLVLTGTLNRRGTNSALRVVRELPGYLRIDETGPRNRTLVFDFTSLRSQTPIDDDDEELAEMLESDTVENFLSQLAWGPGMRRLGDRFKVRGQTGFGSEVDIYEVAAPVVFKRDRQAIVRRYMFDSSTGLLRRVAYSAMLGGRLARVHTVYSDYSGVDGHPLPGRIERIVDGAVTLSFRRESAAITAAVDDGAFTLR